MKRLAIVGLAPTHTGAPGRGPSWDVWRCNPGFWIERYPSEFVATSRWFEIHTRRYLTRTHGRRYARLVEKCLPLTGTPIYFLDPTSWPRVPGALLFPRGRIAKAFPRGDYHAGSFDWMLAFAILEGYSHIELFGVDLGPADSGEPISARPCLEYWCGIAAGSGVTVVSHSPSLFKIFNYQIATTPYHYDDTWRLVEPRRKQ